MPANWYEEIAKMNLTKECYRVLMMLITLLEMDGEGQINQAGLARELGMERQNIHRAIKELIDLKILTRVMKKNRATKYSLRFSNMTTSSK
jgi:DNA-binding MarR family transcriptional regulator